MDQAYPDISPAVKERLRNLKPFQEQPVDDFANPHKTGCYRLNKYKIGYLTP
jgi:hypothetical protein